MTLQDKNDEKLGYNYGIIWNHFLEHTEKVNIRYKVINMTQ